jgi:hypothetical protein
MGKPTSGHALVPRSEYIGPVEGTGGTETSKYPEEEKTKCESLSSGERNGISPNLCGVKARWCCHRGVVGPIRPRTGAVGELKSQRLVERLWKVWP